MLDTFKEYVGEEHTLTRAHKQIALPWSRVLVSKATTRGNRGPAVRMRMALKALLKNLNNLGAVKHYLCGLAALASYNTAH